MIERDPHGRSPSQPGAKLDAGKTRAGLVLGGFARALQAVSAIGTFGAQKYTPNGWVSVPNGIERYTDAMHRHLLAEAAGERLDADSGLAHAAHAAWCALARLDLMLREGQEQPAATAEESSVADADGWIKWDGGARPVAEDACVDLRYRDLTRMVNVRAGNWNGWDWTRALYPNQIIAYRLSKEASHGWEAHL